MLTFINNFDGRRCDLISRRSSFAAFTAFLVLGTPKATAQTIVTQSDQAPATTRRVTITYFKAKPGRLAALERYVRANAFAMDEIAVRQGLFVSYEWLDTGTDDGVWNALITTTYRDAEGFGGVEHLWAPIRAAHREVRPDGLGMKDLGAVVEGKDLFERQPFVEKRPSQPMK
jgi:hypothetical protein